MSSSNCCFLTCIQVSQEASQVFWCSHLFQNFPQFIVIHTVKGFDIVNKAEIYVFMEFSCFFNDPENVGNLISGFSASPKSFHAYTEIDLHPKANKFKCRTPMLILQQNRNTTLNIKRQAVQSHAIPTDTPKFTTELHCTPETDTAPPTRTQTQVLLTRKPW